LILDQNTDSIRPKLTKFWQSKLLSNSTID
jgi:hypothetical protein